MILNGYTNSIQNIKQGDTLLNPYYMGKKYDYIVSNPPFKTDFSFTRNEIEERWSTCSRFIDGVPEIPKKKKEAMPIYLCFIQHVLWALNDAGKAAVVVPAGFLSIKDGIEEKIRRRIVNNGWLSGVIIMPRNTFANTATKVAVLFIDKSKWHQQAVLMDASGLGTLTKIGKNKRIILSEDDAAGQYMKMKNYQNLLSEEEFRDKTLRFEEDYKILCQKEKESDSTIFSILAQVRSNIC